MQFKRGVGIIPTPLLLKMARIAFRSVKNGFTLIEILIVVSIIAILSVIAVPHFIQYRTLSQRNSCIANMRTILNAEEGYLICNDSYALDIAKLCEKSPKSDPFLKTVPKCPCEGVYTFIEPVGSKPPMVTCTGGNYQPGYEHKLESVGTEVTGD